jgi:hypothetical protein
MSKGLDVIDEITYHDFLVSPYQELYLAIRADDINQANICSADPKPLLIGPSLIQHWRCLTTWVKRDGKADLSALRKYEHQLVQVADCSKRQFNEFERTEKPLGDVLDLWEAGDHSGDSLYVKDWHLALEMEKGGLSMEEVYETPDLFKGERAILSLNGCFEADDVLSRYRRLAYTSVPEPFQTVTGTFRLPLHLCGTGAHLHPLPSRRVPKLQLECKRCWQEEVVDGST